MDPERWKQVDRLLQAALERPAAARVEFVRRACAGDAELEREVATLLDSQQDAGSFLEKPAIVVAAEAVAADGAPETVELAGSLAGRTLSHYHVIEKLGDGGMGVVWKARDTRLDRFVALKVLPAAKVSDAERKRRFVQEAKAASALNHPHIITIYDIDQADGIDFIAMELVGGKTLGQAIGRKGLPLEQAIEYAIQVAAALEAAHGAGIVHRDLKPSNLMLTESGSVKVLDFGLAKLTSGGSGEMARTETLVEAPKTSEGMIVGTFSYMSPEQAEGKKVDARTDIFSFGAVLYEMITGRRAFGGSSMVSALSAVLRDEPKPAAEIIHEIPPELDRIVTRCLRKDPNRRYQHAGDLRIDLEQVRENPASRPAPRAEVTEKRSGLRRWWIAVAAACIAVAFAAGWKLRAPPVESSPWSLKRLTNDAGLSGSAALSPDGKLVAYSSDRGADGARDLYVKQVAGGQPVRLTADGAGNTQPDFSPDGSKIVFRSNRDGGGIYEIPAFGGEVRLVARDGLNPKYSPDGSQVAYWVGAETAVSAGVPGSGTLWVVPVAGGQPQRVGPNFTAARFPIWSPDGKHLLAIAYTSPKAYEGTSLDWWLVPANGGDAVQSGAYDAMVHAKLRSPGNANNGPKPSCWSADDNAVIFSNASGEAQNLWKIGISPQTGKVAGVPQRLTTGAGNEVDASCASSGALTFTNVETRRDVWLLPFDLDHGTAKGELERVTQNPANRGYVSLANDGRSAAFSSDQSGQINIWRRDLATGKESAVSRSSFVQRYPVSNASGTRIAFSVFETENKRVVYVSTPGGAPEKLCDDGCLRATDWSRDEKSVLVFGGNPYEIHVLDLASHRQTLLLKHATYNLLFARFSPDNRWVSFTARTEPNRARIVIAPVDGPKPVPESAWITIAEVGVLDWAVWSPDGKTLYFTSPRDGYNCLWGQRVEAGSHRPAGEPFAVQHFHGRVSFEPTGGWSAGGGRIALVLAENTGNVWMMSRAH